MRLLKVLANRQVAALLLALSLQRIALAAYPVARIVLAAGLRGYAAAATIQGVAVVVGTVSTPFRARLLDRVGRQRVIVPQTIVYSVLLWFVVVTLADRHIPLYVVIIFVIASAASAPSTGAVIRTLWRKLGTDDYEVKALHSFDSILEEIGFLVGPALASVAVLATGRVMGLRLIVIAVIAGNVLAVLSPHVRSALRPSAEKGTASAPPPASVRARSRWVSRAAHTVLGPIASRDLQRIVAPLILMGTVFGIVGILAPALCANSGHIAYTGFVLAMISLGGIVGALAYSAMKLRQSLRYRHAILGIVFGFPLVFGFLASSAWVLGGLLLAAGLAVTPLYINSYLMMDEDIPPAVIHEANVWVPVGNDAGYVIGITLGGALVAGAHTAGAQVAITVVALLLVAYSVGQLVTGRRSGQVTSKSADAAVRA